MSPLYSTTRLYFVNISSREIIIAISHLVIASPQRVAEQIIVLLTRPIWFLAEYMSPVSHWTKSI